MLLTRSPLVYSRRSLTARLACVKHAASVRPEPGSNSPLKAVKYCSNFSSTLTNYLLTNKLSELISIKVGEPKLSDGLDGVLLINLVDFWHTVEFSRIRRTPKPKTLRSEFWGNSSNLHCSFSPVKPGSVTVLAASPSDPPCGFSLRRAVQRGKHYGQGFARVKSGSCG